MLLACAALAACAPWRRGGTGVASGSGASVVRVETPTTVGSGFFVGPGLVATSAHVVGERRTATLVLDGDVEAVGQVVRLDRGRDVAILRSPLARPPLPLRASGVRHGEPVAALGFAGGRRVVMRSTGTVHGVLDTMIVHDARLAAGSSGGPLLDAAGRVLGMNAIRSYGGGAGHASDRGLAVRIDVVVAVLAAP
ncbi:MAG: trypsin-like peptidase domain-containing protein [bacterium]|nr:trypsin-like peptidase domain-containing protein [bacterium]